MIARRPSAKKQSKQKHAAVASAGVPSCPRPAVAQAAASQAQGQALPAGSGGQISELEATVTQLRKRQTTLEEALARSADVQVHFQELFEAAPTGYLVHDRNGAILEYNRAAATLLGLRRGPIKPGAVLLAHSVVPPDIGLWLEHMYRASSQLHATTDLNLRGKNGSIPVQMVTVSVPAFMRRSPPLFRTTLIDITQRRAAEEALAQTQHDYHRLIDTIEGIVWEAEAKGFEILFVSRYAERLLGYSLTEWSQPGFWWKRICVEDRERVADEIARAVAKREELRIDYRAVARGGRMVWLHDCIAVVEHGEQLKLLGVAFDITERIEAEEKLRQAHDLLEHRVAERTTELRQTVADLEAFSYSLSHDMRAPLRAMRGYGELLERMIGGNLEAKASEFLRRIIDGASRLDLLVQDVLQYSRVARTPVELKAIPLDRLLENILHDYPPLAPARARIEIQRPLLAVCGHEAFMGQALANLLTNAAKFVPPGQKPRVRLWTEAVKGTGASGPAKNPKSERWVRIWVEDNGLGIAPEDQKRIFRMFERVYSDEQFQGTGIGLAIVQKAVERMGGRVGVESSPGQGSRFWIELRGA